MTKHRKILNLIFLIRESHSTFEFIFLNGSCMNLFCILHSIYPEAKAWYNIDHIITEVDDRFYDITGIVSNKGYLPLISYYNKKNISRAFKQMYNYERRN